MNTMPALPSALRPLTDTLTASGIRPVVVGGYVRDALLGLRSKDIDIECYGVASLDDLAPLLAPFGNVNSVGKSYGVLKLDLDTFALDLSLPRLDTKTGNGHRGFEVRTFESFDFKTAAKRRDFTINAIGYDPVAETLLDPFGGREDLEKRILRCVNGETFKEDPLRLLRAVQFAARFELTPDKQLLTVAHDMVSRRVLDELPKERVFEEIKKLLLKAAKPSLGFLAMEVLGITPYFPQLQALLGREWSCLLGTVDAMASQRYRVDEAPLTLMLAAVCAPMASEKEVGRFLAQLTDDKRLITAVTTYYRYRDVPERLFAETAPDVEIMRLACHVRIDALCGVTNAYHQGCRPANGDADAVRWLEEKARGLDVLNTPKPALITGKDLVRAGLTPSPAFKTVLESAYDAQLAGMFSDKNSAVRWLEAYLPDLGKS